MRQTPMPSPVRSTTTNVPRMTGTLPRSARRAPMPRPTSDRPTQDSADTRRRQEELRQRQAEVERQREKAIYDAERQAEAERRKIEIETAQLQRLEAERRQAREAREARIREEESRRRAEAQRAEEARLAAERRREEELARERERLEREQWRRQQEREMTAQQAWDLYERRWQTAWDESDDGDLTFASIPWPMHPQPLSPTELDGAQVRAFILSPSHSQNKGHKQRLREQLLRFHPDRFEGRWLSRVRESDRAAVQQGVNMVARFLNDALAHHSSM